jgi:prepilin-type N-terminal cleavage/methylation domain-containing protein
VSNLQKITHQSGFTLAELPIAIGVLGVIATFTIPKVLQSQQDQTNNAIGKEAMAAIAGAYTSYKLQNGSPPSGMVGSDLKPYLNYIKDDTTSTIDDIYAWTTTTCDNSHPCIRLHNGAILRFENDAFSGTTATNEIGFQVDPDGKVTTDGSAGTPGKSLGIVLYYNGRMSTYEKMTSPSYHSYGTANAVAGGDPIWYSP